MVDPNLIALINAEIDGELGAAQRAELARWLIANPDARALREDLRRLCTALDGIRQADPPVQLRQNILADLLPLHVKRPGLLSPYWRLAAVIAAVVVAGVIVFETVKGSGPAAGVLSGTIAGAHTPTIVDTVRLGNGPVSGRVSLYRDHAHLAVGFEVVTSAPVDAVIASGGHTLRISDIGGRDNSGAPPGTVALPGIQTGPQSVDVTFLVAGRQVGSATLRAPGGQ